MDCTAGRSNLYSISVAGLRFDEFLEKLSQVKAEFRAERGRDPKTLEELELYLARRKLRAKGRRHLTSLKGLDL